MFKYKATQVRQLLAETSLSYEDIADKLDIKVETVHYQASRYGLRTTGIVKKDRISRETTLGIYQLLEETKLQQKVIADKFKVSQDTVSRINRKYEIRRVHKNGYNTIINYLVRAQRHDTTIIKPRGYSSYVYSNALQHFNTYLALKQIKSIDTVKTTNKIFNLYLDLALSKKSITDLVKEHNLTIEEVIEFNHKYRIRIAPNAIRCKWKQMFYLMVTTNYSYKIIQQQLNMSETYFQIILNKYTNEIVNENAILQITQSETKSNSKNK